MNLDRWLLEQHANGAKVIGVCGGYQMLGERIEDPAQLESTNSSSTGLGLLPVATTIGRTKITCRTEACTPLAVRFGAYEIHMGDTVHLTTAEPFAFIGKRREGIRWGRVVGTYLHGALESADVLEELLGINVGSKEPDQSNYDALASWFEESADLAVFQRLFLR
jgi:adenosylcobyric acid synthase